MKRVQRPTYEHLDEVHDLVVQCVCEHELEAVLSELGGLVLISEMPEETRDHLLAGLWHLRGHIQNETKQLIAEMQGRLN